MAKEYRIIAQYTKVYSDSSLDARYKIQYKGWFGWRDVREIDSDSMGGSDVPLARITWFKTRGDARAWIVNRRGRGTAIHEVMQSFIIYG